MENKNSKVLNSFVNYCVQHPGERFWQALRNWAKVEFVLTIPRRGYMPTSQVYIFHHDTFHREGKNA